MHTAQVVKVLLDTYWTFVERLSHAHDPDHEVMLRMRAAAGNSKNYDRVRAECQGMV